nr:reverse transcriptase zinc-binding domain-containing protein [Tanacetum cinerariifolium]
MSSMDTYSTTSDLVFDEFSSTSKGKVLLDDFDDVANGKGKVLLDEFEDVGNGKDENDSDCEKMFELANIHGYLDVYVGHNPQVIILDLYFKPLEVVCESNEEVTSKYRSQEKSRKNSSTMSLEELIAWEQEETQSPSYLRPPHVLKKIQLALAKFYLSNHLQMNSPENHEWEYLLDIDDSDLKLSAPLRLSNSNNTSLLITQEMYVDEKATRIIPGPAGGGCFGDIKSYLKKGKLEKVVAIVTLCKPNVIGDMNVTLKDPSGTMQLAIDSKSERLSEQILLYVEREMERELHMTRVLTNLCHEVTEATKDKVNLIEEVKQLGGRASTSDSMAYLRILRGEDMDKAKYIMKLIKDTQDHNR